MPFALSQSRIKRIGEELWCPQKFLLCDIEKKYKEAGSEAQMRGQLFEYLAFGSLNREGQVPVLKKTTRGKVTAEEKRIILQASELKRILPLNGMTVLATCVPLTTEWSPGVWMTILMDAVVHWDRSRDPRPENRDRSGLYVLDAKLTGNIHNTFGPFSWGNPAAMNHLQPHVYMEVAERELSRISGRKFHLGFVYSVFDYSPKMEHRLIEVRRTAVNQAETKEQIRVALDKLEDANDNAFAPIGSYQQCKNCPVPDCPVRVSVRDVQVIT